MLTLASLATLGPRRNPVGVQLLAPHMHKQIFPGKPLPTPPSSLLDISKRHLAAHGLSPDGAAVLPELSFDLPPLQGDNIREHFHTLGAWAAEPYLTLARDFATAELPPMPASWVLDKPGWTRYGRDGSVRQVESLNGESMVCFDVETLYKLSKYPVMATAASPDAWYSWLSPQIFDSPPKDEPTSREPWDQTVEKRYPHTLIPLFEGSTTPSIAVGHNVGYDRARVAEEYSLTRTPTRWLDTLSLHVATRGITSVQRPTWLKHRNTKRDDAQRQDEAIEALRADAEANGDKLLAESLVEWSSALNSDDPSAVEVKTWEETTSVNSLADVAKLHCGIKVDKSIRDTFGDESIKHASELLPQLDELLQYCANDVKITHDVYKAVLPLYLASCPHPASFAGILSMGNSFLPVDQSWGEYLKSAETMYRTLSDDVRKALRTLAERLRAQGPQEDEPWASQLDWTPKAARWSDADLTTAPAPKPTKKTKAKRKAKKMQPAWFAQIQKDPQVLLSSTYERQVIPLLLQMCYRGYPVYYLHEHMWCFRAPLDAVSELVEHHGLPVELNAKDAALEQLTEDSVFFRIAKAGKARRSKLVGKSLAKEVNSGLLTSPFPKDLAQTTDGELADAIPGLMKLARKAVKVGDDNEWAAQLNWTPVDQSEGTQAASPIASMTAPAPRQKDDFGTWPKWYWDLTVPSTNKKFTLGELDLTMRKSIAPLLLRMQWHGYPLAYSKEHKWMYRVPKEDIGKDAVSDPKKAVIFNVTEPFKGDEHLVADTDHSYFRVPHKDGEGNNVGNPLSKAFLKSVESGELSSALSDDKDEQLATAATTATNMNALCSYWISARERIMNQFVVYRNKKQGMILPQVITMGTVTRRAVEATWLTASNAKKNRVGSELKAMVRAPAGYAIVGADVDSEELWISSVMGDSQFGVHGATAIGWMTLEGTKSAGTDLHSKTANILRITRDAAKVFNYSRIYGAGRPHAIQLLLQGDGTLTREAADKLATDLYKQTKGAKTFRSKGRPPAASQYLWHGGSESYLFNTLESIALMDRPTTPALGCGVTRALRKSFLDAGHSYLPSRINWVVQSSGVDYLHLLITAMDYLMDKYGIRARYLLSVHDEVRYLAVEKDKYRCALALQIANAWTRALFCYNLGLDDMPQGITFFSAVDIDHILRKETDMTCVTPSHPTPLEHGESLDINALLDITKGNLGKDLRPDPLPRVADPGPPVQIFNDLGSVEHKRFLQAQADATPRSAKAYLDGLPGIPGAPVEEWKRKPRSMPRTPTYEAPQGWEVGEMPDALDTAPGWSEEDLGEAEGKMFAMGRRGTVEM